jgi:MFS transporter, YNFM family, putative membrane transport protein
VDRHQVLGCFGVGGLVYSLCARRIVAGLGEAGMLKLGAGVLAAALAGLALVVPRWSTAPVMSGLGFGLLTATPYPACSCPVERLP